MIRDLSHKTWSAHINGAAIYPGAMPLIEVMRKQRIANNRARGAIGRLALFLCFFLLEKQKKESINET